MSTTIASLMFGNAMEHRIRPDVGLLLANTVSEAELLNPVTFVRLAGQGQLGFQAVQAASIDGHSGDGIHAELSS